MKLGNKIIIILVIIWLAAIALIYFDSHFIILNNYKKLELSDSQLNVVRTKEAIANIQNNLLAITDDWAHWDEAYLFIQNKNPNFIKLNLASNTIFNDEAINYILYYDDNGKLFYSKGYDLETKKNIPISNGLLEYIQNHSELLQHPNVDYQKVGFVLIGDKFYMLASTGITTSNKEAVPKGNIILAFDFNNDRLQKLANSLQIKFSIYDINQILLNYNLHKSYQELLSGMTNFIFESNQQYLHAYLLLSDIEGKSIGLLQADIPRTIYLQGSATIHRYLLIISIVEIFIFLIFWFLLKIILLDRLNKFKKQIDTIKSSNDFSKRITISGQDEINDITNINNEMLDIIELTQNQLKYRLNVNTEELKQLSKLNLNLQSEINRHLTVEKNLQEQEKDLQQKAYYDIVTGLPNRIFFFELLQKALVNAERDKKNVAILFLDLDKFKFINDTYGHLLGDVYLKKLGERFASILRKGDVLARLGGDEFIFYFINITKENLYNLIKRILNSVLTLITIDNHELSTTTSIGISIYPNDGTELEELIKKADMAMYYAKSKGGGTYLYYDEINKNDNNKS